MNGFLRVKFSLVAQIVSQVCVNQTQSIHHRDSAKLEVSPLGLRSLGLSLKAFLLVIGKAKIALPKRVASQGEATILVLPLEVNLALLHRALSSSEAKIASLLAPNGVLSLASRQISLALGAVNESNAIST